jgi:hypothetical protein
MQPSSAFSAPHLSCRVTAHLRLQTSTSPQRHSRYLRNSSSELLRPLFQFHPSNNSNSISSALLYYLQGCHGDGRTDTSVCPSVTSDKVLVRQIRVNAMLTYDKVKPELLCPRWLPRCCHVGWLDVSFHYIARAAEHIVLWRARMAAIGARTATEWGAHG